MMHNKNSSERLGESKRLAESEKLREQIIEIFAKKSGLSSALNKDISRIIIEQSHKSGFYKMPVNDYLKWLNIESFDLNTNDIWILFYNNISFIGEEIKNLENVLLHFLKCIDNNDRIIYGLVPNILDKINHDTVFKKIEGSKTNRIDDNTLSLYLRDYDAYSIITNPILDEPTIKYLKKYYIDKKYDLNPLKKFFQVNDLSKISIRVIFHVDCNLIYNPETNNYEKKFVKKNNLQYFVIEMPNKKLILLSDFIKLIENNFDLVSTDNQNYLRTNFYFTEINDITYSSEYPFTGLKKIYNDQWDKDTLERKINKISYYLKNPNWSYNWSLIINTIIEYNKLLN